jgi:hypothetical protein
MSPAARIAVSLSVLLLALFGCTIALSVLAHQGPLANLVLGAPFAPVGAVIAYRQPRNPIAWILIATSVAMLGFTDAGLYALLIFRYAHHGLPLGREAVALAGFWSLFLVLLPLPALLFPEGRLPEGRWRAVGWAYGALALALVLRTAIIDIGAFSDRVVRIDSTGELSSLSNGGEAFAIFYVLIVLAWLSHKVGAYRRSTGERRAQFKWVVSGGLVTVVGFALGISMNSSHSAALRAVAAIGFLCVFALPIGIGVGILKYRLYDIDRLISRTLSYAILTALLVGTFVGLVVLTTDALPFSSTVGVAASTLTAAALFNPLRVRVQRVVDRRFNRARYDAEETVAAFAARLRDAVDLDTVQTELLEVVQRAVEPASASVWIVGGPR